MDFPALQPKYKGRAVLLFAYQNRKAAVCENDKLAPPAARTLSYPGFAYPTVSLLFAYASDFYLY
jgi:hypothetical protein